MEVITLEMIDKIHDMVLSDQRIKMREIVEATCISQGTVFSILHEKLGVKKISARWMPRLLSEENKRNRVVDTEIKEQSKQWVCDLEFELLQHPPYSPDLAPSDFFLFPNLKKCLSQQRFMSNEEFITQTDAYFKELPKSYFWMAKKSWRNGWKSV